MNKIRKRMVWILIALTLVALVEVKAQTPFEIKSWRGQYPKMNNSYPLTFLAFKGWLPPVPHYFVRIYPTHYYFHIPSVPSYDLKTYWELIKNGTLRTVFKGIDKNALEKSMYSVAFTRNIQDEILNISNTIYGARKAFIPDLYELADVLNQLDHSIQILSNSDCPSAILNKYKKLQLDMLSEIQMINAMNVEQGKKIKLMEHLKSEFQALSGECDYISNKLEYYQKRNELQTFSGLQFLGQ